MKKFGKSVGGLVCGALLVTVFCVLMGAKTSPSYVKEYIVNSYQETENLENWVNDHIKKGWMPLGGVSIAYVKYSDGRWGIEFSQALVKKK